MKTNVATDGPNTADESTIAEVLVKEPGYSYLDTGATYRCTALASKECGINPNDEAVLTAMLDKMKISFDPVENVYLSNRNILKQIHESEISMFTSSVSAHPKVRECLMTLQQQMARDGGFIMDECDIGTVILPDAELRIYMVASVKTRVDHRYKEHLGKHVEADYDEIYRDIEQWDYQGMNRRTSPLRRTEDAIEIDTSNMATTGVVEEVRRGIPTLS